MFEYCAPLDCGCCKNKRKVSVIFPAKIRYQTILYSAEATILDKINGKFRPPFPLEIKDGKMGRYGFCVASSLIWGKWGGGLLFLFVLSKTVVSKKIESIMYMYVQAPYPDTVSHLLILNIIAFWSQKNKNLTTIMNIIITACNRSFLLKSI